MIRDSLVAATMILSVAAQTFVAPARAESISADALIQARKNCLTSVANIVGSPPGSLKVIRQTSDASGMNIDVKVPQATAPWGCLTDRRGKVKDVHFKGSEGAL